MASKEKQFESLLTALEKREARFGKHGKLIGKTTKESIAMWKSIAEELNSQLLFSKILTGPEVRVKWLLMKYRMRKKIGVMGNGDLTDGKVIHLTTLDKRIMRLIGGRFSSGDDTASTSPIVCIIDKKKIRFHPVEECGQIVYPSAPAANQSVEVPDALSEDRDNSEVIIKREIPSPEIIASQDPDATASDAQESHFTNHDSNASYQDDQNSSAPLNHEVFDDFHVETTSDNEILNIIESLGIRPSIRLFRNKKSYKNANINRLLEIEEMKSMLNDDKIRQTKRIADSLASLIDLRKEELNLDSNES